MTTSGFVAGTLVHTDKGLVPIEQLKIGDLVLSRPDNDPQAPNQYKRVTQTFKSPQKLPVVVVEFSKEGEIASHQARRVFCTANHPFWCAVRQQWLPAIEFKYYYHRLMDLDGHPMKVNDDVGYVMASNKAKIGICHLNYSDYRRNGNYIMVDFAGNKIRFVGGDAPVWNTVSMRSNWHPDEDTILLPDYDNQNDFPPYSLSRFYMQVFDSSDRPPFIHPHDQFADLKPTFKATVYHIEVEDFHTYFISKAGILTHTSANITP